MPSPRQLAKEKFTADLRDRLSPIQAAVVAHYSGITVSSITRLRSDLRRSRIRFQVIKNTLADRALGGTPLEALRPALKGPTALAYTDGDPVALAKALVDYARKEQKFRIRAGVLGGKLLAPKEIESLASLPGREVLLARLVGSFKAPYAGLVCTLSGVLRKFVYALDAIRRKKEERGET